MARSRGTARGTLVGVVLVLAATVFGTLAAFAFVFAGLGFERSTAIPLAAVAAIAAVLGVAVLVTVHRIPPLRLVAGTLVVAGVGMLLLGIVLWQAAGAGWERWLLAGLISLGLGAAARLKSSQRR